MLGFQAAPRLFPGQADEQFCLCSSEYEMSMCVIYCTNLHLFKGGKIYKIYGKCNFVGLRRFSIIL